MKITKLVHSCLLVEHEGKKALVDPGDFSWSSGVVRQESLKDIDYVLVTHEHQDHLDATFANVVHELSPNALWFTNAPTAAVLSGLGIQAHTTSTLLDVRFVESKHTELEPWNTTPEHTSFVLFNDLLISGDCQTHDSMHGARYLAGPINGGPWGGLLGELRMIHALNPKPEKFIPVHDWHWNDAARKALYARFAEKLQEIGVEFVPTIDGEPREL